MSSFEIVWHGAIVGFVNEWSQTRGELSPPKRQRLRPFGDEYPDDTFWDAYGLPTIPPGTVSSRCYCNSTPPPSAVSSMTFTPAVSAPR